MNDVLRLLLTFVLLGSLPVNASDAINEMLKLWNWSDPARTEEKFTALLDKGENNPEYAAAVLSQIARTHSLRRNFEASHQRLDDASELLNDDMPMATTLVLLERGRAHNSNNEAKKALEYFRDAFIAADSAQLDDLTVDAAHMIAIASQDTQAERWNLVAMTIAETSDDPGARRWLGPLYNNLGWTYFDGGAYDKALELFEKGVNFRKSMNQTTEWQIARWTVARTWRETGRLDDALAEQLALLDEVDKKGFQLGYINEELGEIYLTRDDPAHKQYFASAYKILSRDDWLQANEMERIDRLKELGAVDD